MHRFYINSLQKISLLQRQHEGSQLEQSMYQLQYQYLLPRCNLQNTLRYSDIRLHMDRICTEKENLNQIRSQFRRLEYRG